MPEREEVTGWIPEREEDGSAAGPAAKTGGNGFMTGGVKAVEEATKGVYMEDLGSEMRMQRWRTRASAVKGEGPARGVRARQRRAVRSLEPGVGRRMQCRRSVLYQPAIALKSLIRGCLRLGDHGREPMPMGERLTSAAQWRDGGEGCGRTGACSDTVAGEEGAADKRGDPSAVGEMGGGDIRGRGPEI